MIYSIHKFFNIRLVCLFVLVFLSATMVKGQNEPQYTQYMYNIGSFNPAYVSTTATPEIIGAYRAQWIDLEGAPRNIRFGANIPFSNEKMGIGFNVANNQLGPTTQTFIDLAYAYQFNVSENTKLSFGMDVGGSFLNVDFSKGTFENPGEPYNAANIKNFFLNIGAGLFLYGGDTWYLGASIPNFLSDGIYDDDVASVIESRMQVNFIGGYVFDFNESLKFKPAFLINSIGGAPLTTNLSANFLINDRFTVGASYRFSNAVSGLAGFQIGSGTFIGYSYDYSTNGLGEFSSGSHEVVLKFYLGKGGTRDNNSSNKKLKGKPKQIDTPRFF